MYGRFVWDNLVKPWNNSHIQQIVHILQLHKNNTNDLVLDAGCGTGNFSLALAKAGFQVVGIDFATGMLKLAKEKIKLDLSNNLIFELADLNTSLKFSNNHFHHIININVLQATKKPEFTLKEFHRVLKPGGTFVLLFMRKSYGSIINIIQKRKDCLRRKNILNMILILFKTFGERIYPVKDWTAKELMKLLVINKFNEVELYNNNLPIIIIAKKQ